MKSAQRFSLVVVTAPDVKQARKLARLALEARLVACANLIPKIESHYWWQGKIERGSEVLILFKTSTRCIEGLEQLVLKHHPYDTPEIIALSLTRGTKRYVRWIQESLAPASTLPRKRGSG
jgi:periplasmic divalent cation tolerance protein